MEATALVLAPVARGRQVSGVDVDALEDERDFSLVELVGVNGGGGMLGNGGGVYIKEEDE